MVFPSNAQRPIKGFFTVDSNGYNSTAPKKRGRGSEAKAKVLVMVQSEAVEGSNKRIKCKVSHIKMKMIKDLKSETIDQEVMSLGSRASYQSTFKHRTYRRMAV